MSDVGIVATSKPASGGTFQYTISMIDALRKIERNKYTIFTTSANQSYDNLGLPIVRLPPPLRTIVEWGGSLFSKDQGLFRAMDKLIAPIYTTYLLASRKPFLFTLHDLQEKYYPENFTLAQRVWRSLTNTCLSKAAAGIICESQFVRNDIQKYCRVDARKIHVIQAPPVSELMEQNGDAENGLELPTQFLFYPAQFFPHKNHVRLVEAFALVLREFPECRLLFTGQKKYCFCNVMAKVSELRLDTRVMHLGYVDTGTLRSVYMRATVIVIPTLFESISIPVYEAFRLGVPVCASNVVGLPEQIGDAGMLFDPFSVDDMAGKLIGLLGDTRLQEELVKRGKTRIRGLTSESYASELDAVLDALH